MSSCFHDISLETYNRLKKSYPDSKKNLYVFKKGHAKKILKFIDRINSDKQTTILIVHCDAGISRSGAVGIFACRYLKLDETRFRKENNILPNSYVYDILCNISQLHADYEKFWEDAKLNDRINFV